ncbi:MAG: hypothetical protein HZC17_08470 [Candidatus Omnitrophica bacterium]|nr:hypothetical protein [Candidatus Omnitrophota bacterium]
MAKKQKKSKVKLKAQKAKPAQKKVAKKVKAKIQKKNVKVKAAAKPVPGKKPALTVKDEKKKPVKAFVPDEEKDLFDEKVGEDIFEKKGLAGKDDEPAAKPDEDEDEDADWDDDDEKEVGEGNKKEDWQTPLPGRFEEDDDDL